MNEENKNAYSEVIEILKLLDDEKKLEALPMEMLELLKSKVNPEYKPIISKDIPLDEQNLQPETFAILNWITQKYWSNETEKIDTNISENISNKDKEQVTIENSVAQESSTFENIHTEEQKDEEIKVNDSINTDLPVLFDHLKWYEKIKIKIVEFFKKIFKRDKTKELQEGNNV